MSKPKKVTVVNHGDVFGKGSDWFTFHCPECNKQVQRKPESDECLCDGCNVKITFNQH